MVELHVLASLLRAADWGTDTKLKMDADGDYSRKGGVKHE